jgi:hypothetical protein
VEPLGAAALLAPATEGAWPGAGEPPAAPAASSVVLPATSLAAAAFTAASSAALSSVALYAAASSAALLSMASLLAVAIIAVTSSSTTGPALESCCRHFCRGLSSSDNTPPSLRTTRACLPLPGARAALEPLAGPPPQQLAGAPLRLPIGPPPTRTPPRPAGRPPPQRDHQRRRSDRRARG